MISKKFCPKCKSENVNVLISAFGVNTFKCLDCSYEAGVFPEKEKIVRKKHDN